MNSSSGGSTYWCHRCESFVTLHTHHFSLCPLCSSSLSPIWPAPAPDFLMGIRIPDRGPASKAAIETIPTVKIAQCDLLTSRSHCAVCKEILQVNTEASELPCQHVYHPGCILPWLMLNNSCPVCRFKLPTEPGFGSAREMVGLRVWRLPGGGFAVGRFTGGNGDGEREREMDGGLFEGGGGVRRVSWPVRRGRRGLGRFFRGFVSLFRRRTRGE
ncbi:hypothetical protein vseg_020583 [Gypsophila vaccaria]